MPNTKHARTPEIIASKIQTEILGAIQMLKKETGIFNESHLNQVSEESIIKDMQDLLVGYLDGALQPLLDEYCEYQLEGARDEQDTVEQAYRQAKGM